MVKSYVFSFNRLVASSGLIDHYTHLYEIERHKLYNTQHAMRNPIDKALNSSLDTSPESRAGPQAT